MTHEMRIERPWAYSAVMLLLGAVLIVYGVIASRWFLLLIWPGLDFLILSYAYIVNSPHIFGKRFDGKLPVWSYLLFGPLHLLTCAVWHLARLASRERSINDVTPQLTIGRRLLATEVQREYDNYVDLTAEFTEPRCIREGAAYLSIPILDGSVPDIYDLLYCVANLRHGRTFVHCAQGHGRTGLFALAVLLSFGEIQSVDEGMRMLKAVRPKPKLNKLQRRCIERFAVVLKTGEQYS